ncbi:MAG: metalloregulator ArsR/SmtB family transcription factor [Actinomycetota bacterium]|nr:metalloregulator ArsR/SmtB family transcription factor [Actinomycetota bacterium]
MAKKPTLKCAMNPKVNELSQTLKVISDPNRLRILCALFSGEKCVCEIEEGLAISQPLASHHLGVLREAGLVEVRKKGTWSYYSLDLGAIYELEADFREFLGVEKLPADYPSSSARCTAISNHRS